MTRAGIGPIVLRATVAFLLVVLAALPAPASTVQAGPAAPISVPERAAGPASAPMAAEQTVSGHLGGVIPQIAVPGTDVLVRAVVSNTGDQPLTGATVQVRLGTSPLRTRAEVARQAAEPTLDDPLITSTPVPPLAAGSNRTVGILLPADRLRLPGPYGVLPMTITVGAPGSTRNIGTFLPYQVRKEYEPMRLAVVLPLTLGPDPALFTGERAASQQAWAAATGPDSAAMRAVRGAQSAPVTWLVDPALVTDPGQDAAPPGTTPTPTSSPAPAAAGATELLTALRSRGEQGLWTLPRHDPDLSALAAADPDVLPRVLEEAAAASGTAIPLPGEAPVVGWLAGSSGASARRTIAGAFPGQEPATLIMPDSRADPDRTVTGEAVRTDSGRHVLATDDTLSALLAQTSDADAAPRLSQHVLADTIALLQESPGRPRTVLALPPRGFDPDPGALATVLSTLRSTPWVGLTAADAMLDRSAADGRTPAVTDPATPSAPEPTPLTHAGVDELTDLAARARGVADVLADPVLVGGAPLAVLSSARWRGHGQEWTQVHDVLRRRVGTLTEGVTVVPSTVNFFAEHGALQVTVVNDLAIEVRDVRLVTEAQGRPPRLRLLSEPDPLRIRPNSRTTVRLDVEAVAAGVVPVRMYLQTPSGTKLGDVSTVRVRVRPTNGWLVLAAGAVIGLVFVAGLFRAIKAGQRRVIDTDLSTDDTPTNTSTPRSRG